ncbi:MAG: S-adenosylmethionine:tRNA ribosyltransferase-isomerase, partial [Muribaculaceae bacterium]
KIRIGNKLYFDFDDTIVAEVIDNTTSRGRTLRFLYDGDHDEFKRNLYALGQTPLPNYIVRDEPEEEDADRYQFLKARVEGAVAAPAASLHFSRELLRRMEIKGIEEGFLTLHLGLGNFREIDVEDLTKHRLDSEEMEVNETLVEQVNRAKDEGRHICAIGTSTMRGIESTVGMNGHIKPFSGWTNKFIFPPYDFTVCDSMVSNFHMSKLGPNANKNSEDDGPAMTESVMLMMVAAFGGYENVMNAYDVAIKEKYMFGAYGDAMLIVD